MNESEYWLKLSEAIRADNELAAISKKKRAGTATFEEIQKYQYRAAQIEAEFLSKHLSEPGSGENSERCYELMQRRYQKVNQDLAEFQEKLDQQAGVKIKAQKAKFPSERARQIANSLEDQTVPVETIQRRAQSAVANIGNSFCDDYIQENAKFRSNAGIKCYITRTTTGKCCAWCTQIAGRYEYGRHPADIFRRHDNCDCTVTYEEGKKRQNVWTKKTWSAPDIPTEALNFKPTVFTPEQARAIERQNLQYKGLTIPGKTDTEYSLFRQIEYNESNPVTAKRMKEFKLYQVTNARNNIYVSEGARNDHMKPKLLHQIDMHLSEVYKMMGIENSDHLPVVYVVDGTEMASSAAASYNAVLNVMYLNKNIAVYKSDSIPAGMNQFVGSKDDRSSYIHEMYHWFDAEKFRRKYQEEVTPKNYGDYLKFINSEAKKHLDKLEKNGYNVKEISQYAFDEYDKGEYYETYTEYRTDNLLKR